MKEQFKKLRNTLLIFIAFVILFCMADSLFSLLYNIHPLIGFVVSIVIVIYVCWDIGDDIFGEKK